MSNKTLVSYTNGNYEVEIFDDGTKIRKWEDGVTPTPIFPETIDIKVTNYCDLHKICMYCHENSDLSGQHADNTLLKNLSNPSLKGMEWAIGGGNPLAYPHLDEILELNKHNEIISNLTVNELHINKSYGRLRTYLNENLIRGLGISYRFNKYRDSIKTKQLCEDYDSIVWHIIIGVVPFSYIEALVEEIPNIKLLLLGYKNFRKGAIYLSEHGASIAENITDTYRKLPLLFKKAKVVSFDNLAIEQLNVKRLFTDEGWQKFYMGDDGTFSMYIDAVNKTFAKTSTSTKTHDVANLSIPQMFWKVKALKT